MIKFKSNSYVKYSLKKNNIYNHIYDKMNNGDKVAESQVQVKNIKGKVEAKEEIEDMTVDRFA